MYTDVITTLKIQRLFLEDLYLKDINPISRRYCGVLLTHHSKNLQIEASCVLLN